MLKSKKILFVIGLVGILLLIWNVSANANTTLVERVDIKTTKAIPEIGDKVSDLDYKYKAYANEKIKLDINREEYSNLYCEKIVGDTIEAMQDDDVFECGKTYIITRGFYMPDEMEIINPSSISSDTEAYINGKRVYNVKDSGTGSHKGKWLFIEDFVTLRETIKKVDIKSEGLNPKAGETVSSLNKNYKVFADNGIELSTSINDGFDNVTVFKKENNELKRLDSEDTFKAGETYFIEVRFIVPDTMMPISSEGQNEFGMLTRTKMMLNGKKVGYLLQSGSGDINGEHCSAVIEYKVRH